MPESSSGRALHQLAYASRVQIPWPDQAAEIDRIVEVSARNNARVDVTGLLLVHDGWFLQALEGPMEAVLTTYGRIVNDPRHGDCKVLHAAQVGARSFPDWHMCARRMTLADEAILDALSMRGLFEPHALTGAHTLRLLTSVRGIQQRAAMRKAG